MRLLALLVLFAQLVPLSAARQKPGSPNKCPEGYPLQEEQKFQDYDVRVYRGNPPEDLADGCVQVLKNERILFKRYTEAKLVIGNDINKGQDGGVFHPPEIPLGTDITGLGKPDLILAEWTGGAHCCFIFHVVQLGESVREIASVDAEHSDYAHFEDLNHDGIYEFLGWDFTFAYWRAGFLQSPAPKMVLRFNGKRYRLAPDLMQKSAPSAEELRNLASDVRNDDGWKEGSPPPKFWGTMLDFIYSGHSDVAWKFADEAWATTNESKSRFLKDFCAQLATSPYFDDLRAIITNPPCKLPQTRRKSPTD